MTMTYKEAISLDSLYVSAQKCQKGVLWKDSVAHFMLNAPTEINKLSEHLNNGTYEPRKPTEFEVLSPKKREILSIPFVDRVYQRSLNDNILYPIMTKSFIYDNCACQRNKGTDFARNRLKEHLHRYYRKHGVEGYVLQMDIKGYYPNMVHKFVEDMFREKIDDETFKAVKEILDKQYAGEKGYNPRKPIGSNSRNSILR